MKTNWSFFRSIVQYIDSVEFFQWLCKFQCILHLLYLRLIYNTNFLILEMRPRIWSFWVCHCESMKEWIKVQRVSPTDSQPVQSPSSLCLLSLDCALLYTTKGCAQIDFYLRALEQLSKNYRWINWYSKIKFIKPTTSLVYICFIHYLARLVEKWMEEWRLCRQKLLVF